MSDIDVWLTFPDDHIDVAIERRQALYRAVGDVVLTHEAPGNRPRGGIYTLALYASPAGPVQVDWYLAPQATSRVTPHGRVLFEDVPVPRGEWQLDHVATADHTCRDQVSWLIAMLFIAVKKLVRGDDAPFLRFLGGAYRTVQEECGLGPMSVYDPTSLVAVDEMVRQLVPYADKAQRRALDEVQTYVRGLVNRV